MFKVLAIPLLGYVIYSMSQGAIFTKSGVWGRTFRRTEEPWSYWSSVAAYSGLAIAMFFWF
jgi:hypothetical protein